MPTKINAAVKEWTLRMFWRAPAGLPYPCPGAAVAKQQRLDTGSSSG
jgi:hypothetical protein